MEVVEPNTWWAWKPGQLAKHNTHGVAKSKIEIMKDRYEKFVSIDQIVSSKRQGGPNNQERKHQPHKGNHDGRRQHQQQKHPQQQQQQKHPQQQNHQTQPLSQRQQRPQQFHKDVIKDVIEIDCDPLDTTTEKISASAMAPLVAKSRTSTPTKPEELSQKRLFSSRDNPIKPLDIDSDANTSALRCSAIEQENIDLNMLSLDGVSLNNHDMSVDGSADVMDLTLGNDDPSVTITNEATNTDVPPCSEPPPVSRHSKSPVAVVGE